MPSAVGRDDGGSAVGKKATTAVDRRAAARAAWLKLNADRAARDARVEAALSDGMAVREKIVSAQDAATAERFKAETAYRAELARIEAAETEAVAALSDELAESVTALTVESVKMSDIANLLGMSLAEVRAVRRDSSATVEAEESLSTEPVPVTVPDAEPDETPAA